MTLPELARLLAACSDEEAAALLTRAIEELRVDALGRLMDAMPPTRVLDYAPHRIELLVSSSEIELRLLSAEKEPFTVEWIERSIRPGDVFYDIGANVGAYSLIAAKATGNGARVYAFEPAPPSFSDLSRNIVLNGCAESVTALPIALWSDDRVLSLASLPTAGAAQHAVSTDADAGAVAMLGISLDDLVERFGLPVPTHAKIDTDGHELEVLRGAERTLARPEWRSLLVEVDRDDTRRNREIETWLRRSGFDLVRRHGRQRSPNFPRPEGRPDVYWTFERTAPRRAPSRARGRSASSALRSAQRRAVTVTLALVAWLFLLLVLLPEELGDRPYDVFGLKF